MNTDQGEFVALPDRPKRVGIITFGSGGTRTVLWLDDYTFQNVHWSDLIEAKKPSKRKPEFFQYNAKFPYLHSCKEEEAQFVAVVSDAPTVHCIDCPAKSADCAGQLRGCQSCMDTRQCYEDAKKSSRKETL